ncbi:hypothetical protein [Eubacterium oxidoreducens]|uniref:Uncharacterized protein n=1 Tax=Eubacterium oxidoreducens TaxID=1732 RepID=A0A1G6BSP6_EUBOX|nr:hypothetical protein [Eubacterium oxidoreducens]SDB23557.1 hypothetical protein SAMN02910417_01756 [Eubacterium oxidoreducens]
MEEKNIKKIYLVLILLIVISFIVEIAVGEMILGWILLLVGIGGGTLVILFAKGVWAAWLEREEEFYKILDKTNPSVDVRREFLAGGDASLDAEVAAPVEVTEKDFVIKTKEEIDKRIQGEEEGE